MKTLARETDKQEILERLERINASSVRQWGRMTVGEMVCHLSDSFMVAMGEREARSVSSLFGRTVMKWAALKLPAKWPQGVQTVAECAAGKGGTPPLELERDKNQLRALIGQFTRQGQTYAEHPIFGRMSNEEWLRWGYLHMDHHLRQFEA
ncbi:MAG TPA: DUF1569 domain-containing protein [Terracidiphilus sp.]|nr:DUF1569 domain-containing protein [Terracidiphilus sp.]